MQNSCLNLASVRKLLIKSDQKANTAKLFVLPVLYEVLEAPLCGVACLLPLIIHVHQCDVVAAGQEEVLTRRVRVDDLVLGSV